MKLKASRWRFVAVGSEGLYNVTVTVSDGIEEVLVSFIWTIAGPATRCGPLTQEAETYATIRGFLIGNDVNASGGRYLYTPDADVDAQVNAADVDSMEEISSDNWVASIKAGCIKEY